MYDLDPNWRVAQIRTDPPRLGRAGSREIRYCGCWGLLKVHNGRVRIKCLSLWIDLLTQINLLWHENRRNNYWLCYFTSFRFKFKINNLYPHAKAKNLVVKFHIYSFRVCCWILLETVSKPLYLYVSTYWFKKISTWSVPNKRCWLW